MRLPLPLAGLCLLLLCPPTHADVAPPAPPPRLSQLSWLAGCWSIVGREPGSMEMWMAPAGGVMLGASRIVKDGQAVQVELLQIVEGTGGEITYVARPRGQAEASFRLIELGPTRITFAEPSHDFPQRIVYERSGAGQVEARIEGEIGGQLKVIRFPMASVSCAP